MNQAVYSPKIRPEHLARKAIVYLRQSTDKQVHHNTESQRLQYQVAERMRAFGWKQVETVSSDLGFSAGIASARREGFERVLSSVALGEVDAMRWETEDLAALRQKDPAMWARIQSAIGQDLVLKIGRSAPAT